MKCGEALVDAYEQIRALVDEMARAPKVAGAVVLPAIEAMDRLSGAHIPDVPEVGALHERQPRTIRREGQARPHIGIAPEGAKALLDFAGAQVPNDNAMIAAPSDREPFAVGRQRRMTRADASPQGMIPEPQERFFGRCDSG